MKEKIEMVIGWAFPVLNIIIIVLAATRRELKGKPWLVAQLAVSLVVTLAWRAPEVLSGLDLMGSGARSQFYSRFGLPLNIIGIAGFCLLIPYVLAAADTKSPVTAGAVSGSLDGGSSPPALPDSPYKGYGGWLALFGAVQLFVQPIIAVVMLFVGAAGIAEASSQYPSFVVIYLFEALGSIAVVGLGMRAAIKLRGIRPGAVRAVKLYLLVALAWSVLSFVLPYFGDIPDRAREAMTIENVKGFIRTIIPFAIWFSYFNVSKRVKATYVD